MGCIGGQRGKSSKTLFFFFFFVGNVATINILKVQILLSRKLLLSLRRLLENPYSGGRTEFLPNGCSRKMPLSFRSFEWGRLLEHSFLEHFCLDHFSVILGKYYMQDSRTPRLLEHFWVPILGASCSNKLFVGTVRPSHLPLGPKLLHYITLLFRINFPRLCNNSLHCRIGFELFPRLCNLLCCYKAYHVGIGLHYIIVFKLI